MTISSPSLANTLTATPSEDRESLSRSAAREAAIHIRRYRAPLVDRWVELVRGQSRSSYSQCSPEELRESAAECLRSYEVLLRDGDCEPLWHYVETICQKRAAMHFPPGDIVEAFLLFLDAADEVLTPRISPRSLRAVQAECRNCARAAIRSFVNSYWIHLETTAPIP